VCVLKYISYISYIRFFEGLKMPYLQGFFKFFCEWLPPNLRTVTPLFVNGYSPICGRLPPLLCYCLAMLLLSGCSCKALKTGGKTGLYSAGFSLSGQYVGELLPPFLLCVTPSLLIVTPAFSADFVPILYYFCFALERV